MQNLFNEAPISFRKQNGGDYAISSVELCLEADPAHLTGFAAHNASD